MKQIIRILHKTEISSTYSNCFHKTIEQQRAFVRKLVHGTETKIHSTRSECMDAATNENIASRLACTCKTVFLVGGTVYNSSP